MKISVSWTVVSAVAVLAAASFFPAAGQTPAEPGAPAGVELVNISKNTPNHASVFPQVAVSRTNPNIVAVAWRQYGLPIDTNALKQDRLAECHVAVSMDGGKSFRDTNMTPYFRTPPGIIPELWGCNAPWVTIAKDGTMYAGGALFTAGGVVQVEPKAGRQGVSVSTDNGASWSKMVPGIMINRFMPGMTGLNGGMNQEDTPWDGANGFVDPVTGTVYSMAGAYMSASDDKGKNFGTVYQGKGTSSAAFGNVVGARTVTAWEGAKCPCLIASVTSDKGKSWSEHLVAQALAYNNSGTVRYPIAAASPAKAGNYAIAVYQPDHKSVKLYYSADNGTTWKMAAPRPIPAGVASTNVNQVDVGYTSDGRVLVTWRGFRNPSVFNTFVAMLTGDSFGPTVKVTPEPSIYPPLLYVGNYNPTAGGGDFTTWVTGNNEYAFVATPYMPGGVTEDTFMIKVPLSLLK